MRLIDESRATENAQEPPDEVALPQVPRSPHVKSVSIRARQVVPPNQREVWLYYAENGKRVRRTLTVGRPTVLEEVVVAVVDEISTLPQPDLWWPRTPREGASVAASQLRHARSGLLAPLRFEQPVYDVRAHEPNNMAHLLLSILPMALFASDALGPEMVTVFRDVRGPFRELLNVLEINAMFTSRRLEGPMVKVRATRNLAAYEVFGMADVESISLLPHIYDRMTFDGSKQAEKIYLARRGARALLNHAEVERALVAHGYETIYMEDYSVREQLAIAAQAKHVVAIHGAAMATLVMSRGIDSVVELLPPHVYHSYFPVCLSGKVRLFAQLMSEYDEAVPHSGWDALLAYKDAPFAVDLPSLERALSEVGG